MAKLVIGTNKNNTGTAALVRDVSPSIYKSYTTNAQGVLIPDNTLSKICDFSSVKQISINNAFDSAYKNNTIIHGEANLSNLESISATNVFTDAFNGCTGLTSVNLSSLTSTGSGYSSSFQRAFKNCTGLVSLDLSSLVALNGAYTWNETFMGCINLASVDLHNLDEIGGQNFTAYHMFDGCTSLTSVDLSTLRYMGTTTFNTYACEYMFRYCSNLTHVDLSSVKEIQGGQVLDSMFDNCTSLTSISFPGLAKILPANTQSQFNVTFSNCPNLAEIHFPINMQSRVSQLNGYSSQFGAVNATIYFDLPSTVLLTGANNTVYERNPKTDSISCLGWRVNNTKVNTTSYYTSTTNDPIVGDIIYGDPECTQAITTITSIA